MSYIERSFIVIIGSSELQTRKHKKKKKQIPKTYRGNGTTPITVQLVVVHRFWTRSTVFTC